MISFYIEAIDIIRTGYKCKLRPVFLTNLSQEKFPVFETFYTVPDMEENVFYFYSLKAVRKYIKKYKKFFPERVEQSFKIRVKR